MSTLWGQLREKIACKIGESNFSRWFSYVRPIKEEADKIVLGVPDKFYLEGLEELYSDLLRVESTSLAGRSIEILFEVDPELAKEIDEATVTEQRHQLLPTQNAPTSGLNPKYTFDRFVVGSSNQFAHAAAKAVADLPGGHYNPLFVYGGVGLGKTHLVSAIGLEILKKYPNTRIIYVPAESFMNEVIFGIRFDKMVALRRKYRTICDVLLMDDIQFLGGKERTQDEFFHTFNTLFDSHKQIVVTSDRFPKDIPDLEERLRSRFEWGLIADIQPPDLETRIAILKKKSDLLKTKLSDDVAMYLATRIRSNIRELEGSLIRLSAYSSLHNTPITIPFAEKVLSHVVSNPSNIKSIDSIQKLVSDHFKVKLSDMKSPRRFKTLVIPRQIAMYLCKKYVEASFPEIGEKFGGKDHTTVIHACKKIENEIGINQRLKDDINSLENMLKSKMID